MPIVIPEPWRTTVAEILRQQEAGTIEFNREGRRKWQNLDEKHYDAWLYALLVEQLSARGEIRGKKHDMKPEGETYSFSFRYHPPSANGEIELYTKLSLLPGGQVVIIYSAHS
jgi:hypothetical protein